MDDETSSAPHPPDDLTTTTQPPTSSASTLTASTLYLTLDDPTTNPVEEAGPNHFERPAPTLTPLEQFYVDVAHSFAQQQITQRTTTHKATTTDTANADSDSEARLEQDDLMRVHQYLGRTRATLQHFASMLDKLLTRKTLNVAFTQPDNSNSGSGSAADDKPTDPAFQLSRRNRLAALIQSHSATLASAGQLLSDQHATLSRVLRLTARFTRDLSHLSSYWLLRVRPPPTLSHHTTATLTPHCVVDVGWSGGQGEAASRVRLDRDGQGRVEVSEEVGRRGVGEEEQLRRTQRRRRAGERLRQPQQHQQPTHMTAEQRENEEEMAWENDDTAQPDTTTTTTTPPPPPLPTSSSLPGWPRTAARLHRHQRHLLQQQLYSALMTEARSWSAPHLASVSVLSDTIHCHSPAFPPLAIAFTDGPKQPFTLHTTVRCVDGRAMYVSLLRQLTTWHAKYAACNRPTDELTATPPPVPQLLGWLVSAVWHCHIVESVRGALCGVVVQHAPHVSVSDTSLGSCQDMRFVLKRCGQLLLDGVVDGVSMYAVVRRGQRVGVLDDGYSSGGMVSEVSALDVELVRCVSVKEMVQLIHFAVQPTYNV